MAIKLNNSDAIYELFNMRNLTNENKKQIIDLYDSIKDIININTKTKLEKNIRETINIFEVISYYSELEKEHNKLKKEYTKVIEEIKYIPNYDKYNLIEPEEYDKYKKKIRIL